MKWESSNDYSREDLVRMQQDAVERVKEMQRRSSEALKNTQRTPTFFNSSVPNPGTQMKLHNQKLAQNQDENHIPEQHNNTPPHQEQANGNISNQMPPHQNMYIPNQFQRPQQFQQPNQQTANTPPTSHFKEILDQTPLAGLGKSVGNIINTLVGPSNAQGRDTISKLLEVLHLDGERILILMLILLLYNDGADYTLLFALIYLFF